MTDTKGRLDETLQGTEDFPPRTQKVLRKVKARIGVNFTVQTAQRTSIMVMSPGEVERRVRGFLQGDLEVNQIPSGNHEDDGINLNLRDEVVLDVVDAAVDKQNGIKLNVQDFLRAIHSRSENKTLTVALSNNPLGLRFGAFVKFFADGQVGSIEYLRPDGLDEENFNGTSLEVSEIDAMAIIMDHNISTSRAQRSQRVNPAVSFRHNEITRRGDKNLRDKIWSRVKELQ